MPILYADRIRLRASEREDIPLFLKWINDPDVCEYLEQYAVLNRVHEENWFEQVSSGPRTGNRTFSFIGSQHHQVG